ILQGNRHQGQAYTEDKEDCQVNRNPPKKDHLANGRSHYKWYEVDNATQFHEEHRAVDNLEIEEANEREDTNENQIQVDETVDEICPPELQELSTCSSELDTCQSLGECGEHLQEVKRVHVHGQMFYSDSYTRIEKRKCSIVLFDYENNRCVGTVEKFYLNQRSGICYAKLHELKVVGLLVPSISHIVRVERTGTFNIVPVDNIVENVLFFLCDPTKMPKTCSSSHCRKQNIRYHAILPEHSLVTIEAAQLPNT
ncbi:hypothetical protein MAR_005897, partial [Mya arenaria]